MSVTSSSASAIIDANVDVIEGFAMALKFGHGVKEELVKTVTKELSDLPRNTETVILKQLAGNPVLAEEVISGMIESMFEEVSLDDEGSEPVSDIGLILSAPYELVFLVRIARKIDPAILSPDAIPSVEVAQAVLVQHFNQFRRAIGDLALRQGQK